MSQRALERPSAEPISELEDEQPPFLGRFAGRLNMVALMATLWGMNTAAAPVDVQGVLTDSTAPLRRWETRRRGRGRRPVSQTQLRAAAWGMIDSFEELLSLPCSVIGIEVRSYQVPDDAQIEADDETEKLESVNSLLESVRRVTGYFTGASAVALVRALRAREPDLAEEYESRHEAALNHLVEWERLLIFLGAGNEDDAHLAEGLVPPVREDLPPGPSVSFDL